MYLFHMPQWDRNVHLSVLISPNVIWPDSIIVTYLYEATIWLLKPSGESTTVLLEVYKT